MTPAVNVTVMGCATRQLLSLKVKVVADNDTPAADVQSDTTTCDPAAGLEPTATLSCPVGDALRSRVDGEMETEGATLLAHSTVIARGASAVYRGSAPAWCTGATDTTHERPAGTATSPCGPTSVTNCAICSSLCAKTSDAGRTAKGGAANAPKAGREATYSASVSVADDNVR